MDDLHTEDGHAVAGDGVAAARFGAAGRAYADAGLPANEDKQVRNGLGGTVLGAHLDASGWLSAPPLSASLS